MHILNEDAEPHRFKFIPVSGSAWSLPDGAPTFMAHEDGSLTFCLAAAEEVPSGFRIRTQWTMTKSAELHTYRPENVGTNAEKVINLANLFDDLTLDENGWSMWSRELTFDDINFVNSNGGVTIVFNSNETPNYWFDFTGITTLSQFFSTTGLPIQYVDN